ncbi:unnamed protein product [Phytophthora fragariaefolia]|uniref:Unnamed protein product n=1 Tax=Phytophthora fragariaefolia TaxID=1490495 RepID=A0A9W6XWH9_9STRA|nr:unnamed protein product [Phytophthora fragariaefolia]
MVLVNCCFRNAKSAYYSVPKQSQQKHFGETLSVKTVALQLLLVEIDATALCDFNDVLSSTSDQELAPVHSFSWHTGRETAGQSELGFRPFSMSPIPEPTSTSTMPSSPSAPRRTKKITITESYWELPPQTINAAFLSLQDSMD